MQVKRWVLVALLLGSAALVWTPTGLSAAPRPTPVFAYYYIWFNTNSWDRAKVDFPLLGRYSSDDTEVMRKHVQWAKQAGIERAVTPMAIRHTVATHLLAEGVSIRHIQSLLGHKSVETTTIYTKVTPLDLQQQLRKFHPRQKERRRH